MSVPWRDKAGVVHAWLSRNAREAYQNPDNEHAGWYTARAPCGASRRLRHGYEDTARPRDTDVDCMACIAKGAADA